MNGGVTNQNLPGIFIMVLRVKGKEVFIEKRKVEFVPRKLDEQELCGLCSLHDVIKVMRSKRKK